jgi:sugar phosphate isomerase/epimerase
MIHARRPVLADDTGEELAIKLDRLTRLEGSIRERLEQHKDNLALWESGYLNPTEPDPDERRATMERLRVAIEVLESLDGWAP